MTNLENKLVKLTKLEDTAFKGKHPMGINTGYEREGRSYDDIKVNESFAIITDRGYLKTSKVTKVNDDMTFNTLNSVYKVEVLGDF